jgi:CheY-like chemotaxis protein
MANSRAVCIVIAEDSVPDVILFKEALRSVGIEAELKVFSDGEECASYFRTTETPPPDLIVLDLNLPKVDGFDLIRLVRNDRRYDRVPVAVLTSSTAAKDKNLSLDLGANTFISKPSRLDEFLETIGSAVRLQLRGTDHTATLHLTWGPGGPKPPAGRRRRATPRRAEVFGAGRRALTPPRHGKRPCYARAGRGDLQETAASLRALCAGALIRHISPAYVHVHFKHHDNPAFPEHVEQPVTMARARHHLDGLSCRNSDG